MKIFPRFQLLFIAFFLGSIHPVIAQDVRKCDYFGFQCMSSSSLVDSDPGGLYVNYSPQKYFRIGRVTGSLDYLYGYELLHAGYLPIPFDESKSEVVADSIAASYLRFMGKETDREDLKLSVASKEPFSIPGLKNAFKYHLLVEELENEGIVGKEGYVQLELDEAIIGFADDRAFMFTFSYGQNSPKDKTYKDRNKTFQEILKSFVVGPSPRDGLVKSETEGCYFALLDSVHLGGQSNIGEFDNNLLYRDGDQFIAFPDPLENKVPESSDPHVMVDMGELKRLEASVESQMGVTKAFHVHSGRNFDTQKINYLFFEDKPGVFYLVRAIDNPVKKSALDGEFGAEYGGLMNVFSKNRSSMPEHEVAVKRSKQVFESYYSHLSERAKSRLAQADAIRKPSAGKIIFRSGLAHDAPAVTTLDMSGENFLYLFAYPSDGMQQGFEKTDFRIRVSANQKTGSFPLPVESTYGSLSNRGHGGTWFAATVFQGNTNEINNDEPLYDEMKRALTNKFVINTINLLKLPKGFKGPVKVELLDETGKTMASGSLNFFVDPAEYSGENDLCALPTWSYHDPEIESAMMSAFLNYEGSAAKVNKVFVNDREWTLDEYGSTVRGRSAGARIMFTDKKGLTYLQYVEFYSQYDYRSDSFSDILRVERTGLDPRPIGCECDIAE